jgi:hypothetical protein
VSPFSKAYTPQLDAAAIKRQARASKTATANREAGMASADPERRFAATGTMPHLKASPTRADKTNSRM